jgi:hypothetical protein
MKRKDFAMLRHLLTNLANDRDGFFGAVSL